MIVVGLAWVSRWWLPVPVSPSGYTGEGYGVEVV